MNRLIDLQYTYDPDARTEDTQRSVDDFLALTKRALLDRLMRTNGKCVFEIQLTVEDGV